MISGLIKTSGWLRFSVTSVTTSALVHVDLRRSQAYAGSRVHRLEHVVDQPTQRVVHLGDGSRPGAQSRIRIFEDGELRHSFENADKVKSAIEISVCRTGLDTVAVQRTGPTETWSAAAARRAGL